MASAGPDFTPLKDPEPPKSLADRILSAIPIIMTVLSTLLAGLSSSEMTQAQYYRSLAAQFQSKVGDQWNFFQAKRQRGAIVAGQMDVLRAESAGQAELDFRACAGRLQLDLERTARRTEQLVAAAGTLAGPLAEAAQRLHKEAAAQADHTGRTFVSTLSQAAPDYRAELRGERFRDPRPALRSELVTLAPELPAVLDAIDSRKPETEILAPLAGISAEQLNQAIDLIEARAGELDAATRDTVKRFERTNELVAEQTERLRPLHGAARALERGSEDLKAAGEPAGAELRAMVEAAVRAARQAATTTQELVRAAQLARNEYNERRYECEARYNQVVAGLYEAQVRKSSVTADKHRRRSYLFFYSMLIAQGGVTLATFALAVRQMSALWGLATVAGLAALAAGFYVYWFI